jgi:predicted ATPase
MKNIILNNFRVFEHPTEFQLAPITILTGRNNSGKSSVIKALLILDDYFNCEDQFFLNFYDKSFLKHKINGFDNAINWNNSRELPYFSFILNYDKITIEFEFIKDSDSTALLSNFKLNVKDLNVFIILNKKENNENNDLIYDLKFTENIIEYFSQTRNKDRLNSLLKIQKNAKKIENERTVPKRRIIEDIENLKNMNLDDYDKYTLESEVHDIQIDYSELRTGSKTIAEVLGIYIINFDGIIKSEQKQTNESPENESSKYYKSPIDRKVIIKKPAEKLLYSEFLYAKFKSRNILNDSFSLIYDFKNLMKIKVEHLSPNRTRQERLYIRNSSQTDIEKVLAEYSNSSRYANEFLSKWLKEFGIGNKIHIENIEGVAYKVKIETNDKKIDLVDMGFGTGQILTILLQIANTIKNVYKPLRRRTNSNYYIIIEEPESNLHPQFQAKMAELIVSCLGYGINFILETHSEYLIGKLQVLIANQNNDASNLTKDDVVIYYIMDKIEDKKILKEIFINNDGSLTEAFGEGFTDVTTSHLIELFKVNKSRISTDENI